VTARTLSGVADEVVTALYDFTTVHLFRARNPTQGERLAVLAVGGYGRGVLAPYSDLDLLFLRPYKATAHVESVIEFMLYVLWDLGLKVGHASRTADECIRLARQDSTIRTALLEARPLAGDAALSAELKQRFRKEVIQGTGSEFIAAKLAERDRRHARAGASRYLVEPNVKESKGGLRDLNTLFWIARYLHPVDEVEQLIDLDLSTPLERKAFVRALDFLWAVRTHLHFAAGRAEERLTFDFQPEVARRMGYADRGGVPAVERFMRRYFLIAREVGRLTRTFCAQLEARQQKRAQGLSRFFSGAAKGRRTRLQRGFAVENGRLTVAGPQVFKRDPANLIHLFQIADQRDLDLHPDAFAAAIRSLNLINAEVRSDPEAVRAFLDILAYGRDIHRTLSLMNEAGVLGRFIPEFGGIVGQMQFNMYHAYTVDEHTLRAVGIIADVAAGRLAEDHPLSTSLFPNLQDREALFLAMLLHDTGKGGEGGQTVAGAKTARAACERLGLSAHRVELVAWLVENHLAMSDFAQKRDVDDPRTIEAFARLVGDVERLRLLLILTVADIRAVAPGVWNGWKGQLLRDLYTATAAALAAGGRAQRAVPATAKPAKARPLAAEQTKVAARISKSRNAAQVTVTAPDRTGLFADLAAAIAGEGGNIVGARAGTSPEGGARDIFFVQDGTGAAFGAEDPGVLKRLRAALEAAALGERPPAELRAAPVGRAAAFAVLAEVAFDNAVSDTATVVEISGRDRPGLLAALARALSDAGLSVQSAHIENYGERAVDVFYVVKAGDGKLTAPDRLADLKAKLLGVLHEGESPAPPNRPRARASLAR
jgi:[protein-PII] uridylyltransferase